MIFYRLVNEAYREDLSGYGSFLYGGRWNSKGLYALYGAEHISLAALEIVVNYDRGMYKLIPRYYLLTLEVPETEVVQISNDALKKKWTEDFSYTQFMGDQFLRQNRHLVLRVPSAVIPEEYNLLLNPRHKDNGKVKIIESKLYGLDNRLFG
ncbi:MAG: RES family NAD+ phosphorylase [Niabella sp.]|nr:RES family NAD+ phosphorylase [Niabella sp.]